MASIERFEISRGDLGQLFFKRPGLIVGPDVVHSPEFDGELTSALCKAFGIEQGRDGYSTAEKALEDNDSDDVRSVIRDFIDNSTSSPYLTELSKIRWSSVLSLARSSSLDQKLLNYSAGKINRSAPMVISEPIRALHPHTYPFIKLLGSTRDDDFAITSHDVVRRSTVYWRNLVPIFSDSVQEGSVLCIGTGTNPEIVFKLFTELSTTAKTTPQRIVFLSNDPILKNSEFEGYFPTRSQLIIANATIGEICNAAANASDNFYTLPLVPQHEQSPFTELKQYSDVVQIVNDRMQSSIKEEEHNVLNDILFRPTSDRWEPYVYDLDFKRTATEKLVDAITNLHRQKMFASTAVVLQGSAGCGKTTILKRAAFNIARDQDVVAWIRGGLSQDASARLYAFMKSYAAIREASKRLVIFLDDRFGATSITPRDVVSAASQNNLGVTLVVSGRVSEWSIYSDIQEALGGLELKEIIEVSDSLDSSELTHLPEYLIKLGVCADIKEANYRVKEARSQHARDMLGLLWLLLPQTRKTIEKSVSGEYFRLGDYEGFAKAIADVATSDTAGPLIQRAYAYVAVAEHAQSPIPTEVLISALGGDYSLLEEGKKDSSPIWGLLYGEYDEDQTTVCYRTRNSIIADVIVRSINAGVMGVSGELAVLEELLSSCTGVHPAYRAFCLGVLVPHGKLSRYEYDQGLRLYDAAINALPVSDRTLLHHKGIWTHHAGKDPVKAIEILKEALATQQYPYSQRIEREEHIHTSMAACEVTMVKMGLSSADEAKTSVLGHLDLAHSSSFFNAHAVHVEASIVTELLSSQSDDDLPDACALANRAISDIDRAVTVIKTDFVDPSKTASDIGMLENARDNVTDAVPISGNMVEEASRMWAEKRRQDGFVYVVRGLYRHARSTGKGKEFKEAFEYALDAIELIEESGTSAISPLYSALVEVYYYWRVTRAMRSDDPIDWELIGEYSGRALQGWRNHEEPLLEYLRALSYAHSLKWPNAQEIFTSLRSRNIPNRLLYLPRDYFLAEDCQIQRFQAKVRRHNDTVFVAVEALKTDFMVDKNEHWPDAGLDVLVYIQFSFAGPRAVQNV